MAIENTEYCKMLKRMIRSGAKRTACSDEADLKEFYDVYKFFGDSLKEAVKGQVSQDGKSWSTVAHGLGMSRQGAYQRFSK